MTGPDITTPDIIVALDEATGSLALARFLPSEAQEGAELALRALERLPEDIRPRFAGCIDFARATASAIVADSLSPPPWNNGELHLRCKELATALDAISAEIRPAQPIPLSQRSRRQHKPRIPPPDGLKTAAEAAAKLGCSVKTLHAHVDAGDLHYVIVGKGKKRMRRMFNDADLDEFITNQTRKDSPCPSIASRGRRSSTTISGGEVVAFTALRKRPRDAKPRK
jgi:hypothetical protein